jgi:glucose-6-phosphate isomerase
LQPHARRLRAASLVALFAADPSRIERMHAQACGLSFDYSRQAIDGPACAALAAQSPAATELWHRMWQGELVNRSEQRAALHTLARSPAKATDRLSPSAQQALALMVGQRERMLKLAEAVREGSFRGATGHAIQSVVHIGIGGSDLGPAMVLDALSSAHDPGPEVRFLSNLDPVALERCLVGLDPHRSLVVIVSKTFTTLETLLNARALIATLAAKAGLSTQAFIEAQVIAVTAQPAEARQFGIAEPHVLGFDMAIGGRFSLWSAVGLPIALRLGKAAFESLLRGAHAMDQHTATSREWHCLPLAMAMVDFWNHSVLGYASHAIVPYSQALARLPAYLQQLEMESNGKSAANDGSAVSCATAPVLWGEPGTNGQHAFFQMLHQGTQVVPVDFIVARHPGTAWPDHHRWLVANCIAQGQALMLGQAHPDPQQAFPGNRPSSTLVLEKLDPYHLGALLAAYEHKVVMLAGLWGINPFDQWGVELGKKLAKSVYAMLDPAAFLPADLDPATRALIERLR